MGKRAALWGAPFYGQKASGQRDRMTSEAGVGWLGTLVALWNAEGLAAWTAKLIAVLAVVFALTALSSLGSGRTRSGIASARPARRQRTATAAPARTRVVPPKNLKKKPVRIIRRYRPRSHAGTLRPLTRRVGLKLVEKDKTVLLPRPAQPAQPAVRQRAL